MEVTELTVKGKTFTHKDTLKGSFRMRWDGEHWGGRYLPTSVIIPKVIAYCAKHRLELEIDGEIVDTMPEVEADYIRDIESRQIHHVVERGGEGYALDFDLPSTLSKHEFEELLIDPNEDFGWSEYSELTMNDGPYTESRVEQEALIPLIANALKDGYKNVVVECNTGAGKSAIAYWLPLIFDERAYVSTPLKGLQEQYVRDHKFMASAMGRSNYLCELDDEELDSMECPVDATAANAPCRMVENFQCDRALNEDFIVDMLASGEIPHGLCGYYKSYAEALLNRWFVGNTSFLTAMHLHGKPSLGQRPLLIVDECHTLDEDLRASYNLNLSKRRLKKLLMKDIPDDLKFPAIRSRRPDTSKDQIKQDIVKLLLYLRRVVGAVEKKITARKYDNETFGDAKDFVMTAYRLMDALKEDFMRWIYSYDDDSERNVLRFEPIHIQKEAEGLFLELGRQRVFMSGSIPSSRIFMRDLGLKKDETIVFRITKSSFPAKSRPFISRIKGGRMVWDKNIGGIHPAELEKVADAIARIASHYPDQQGLLLPYTDSVEANLADLLADKHPEVAARLVQHTKNPQDRDIVLKDFRAADDNGILCSTYTNQGYDNPNIKFVIIAKVPFLSLADTRVRILLEEDEEWYQVQATKSIIQMYGRAMRSKEDWGHVYVVDNHFGWWYDQRNIKRLMPPYVLEALDR